MKDWRGKGFWLSKLLCNNNNNKLKKVRKEEKMSKRRDMGSITVT